MRVLSLFSGIGGLDLAAEWAGMEVVAFCEIEEYPVKVLKRRWPDVPVYNDVRELNRERLERDGILPIDIITGGFPCQPFSTASRGRRVANDLSGEFIRIIGEAKPRYIVGENVGRRIIRDVGKQLRAFGYGTSIHCNRAYDYGADHIRYRWWAVAYPDDKGKLSGRINAEMAIVPKVQNSIWTAQNMARTFRVPDGIPNRMDRLKALGNAVVPQQAYPIFKAIMEVEE